MKVFATTLICIVSLTVFCQDPNAGFDPHSWEAPYMLATPKDWAIERFLLPISFAPQIPYKGIEDIRFTPGWAKKTSEEYWSYAFLWYLEGEVKMDPATIGGNLKDYYAGLIDVNGSNIPKEKLIPVTTSFNETPTSKGDLKTYTGTIQMLDYMTQKPITLHAKVHWKSCPGENRTFIFYELSPKELTHSVWLTLDQLWVDFKCTKK